MIYGYVRISTQKQNIERQVRNILRVYPTAVIVREIYTGRTQDRPKWVKLQPQLQQDDVIVFDSVSRMARDSDEGFNDYQNLFGKILAGTAYRHGSIQESIRGFHSKNRDECGCNPGGGGTVFDAAG